MNTDYYTIEQIAEKLQVVPTTVRAWIRDGELPALYLSGKRNVRVSGDDLNEFLDKRKKGANHGERERGLSGTA